MLVGCAVVVALVNLLPGKDEQIAVGVFEALLTIATGIVIARGVIDQGEINFESVRGAIAIYVLLGLLFTFLYGALAAAHSPLFAQGIDGTRSLRLYFSYVTLTTLGYGDYSPANTVGHLLAIVEALVGQLYLVTIVALLVSRLHAQSDDDRPVIPPG
jgi:voltage-gated potassium channel Kch